MNRVFLLLVLVAAAGAAGFGAYLKLRSLAQLNRQLYRLDQLLIADNDDADQRAQWAIRGLEAAVQKNYNQPKEVALLAAAQRLDGHADSLARTLRGLGEELKHNACRPNTAIPTAAQLASTDAAAQLLSPDGPAYVNLHQQLNKYRLAAQALNPNKKAALPEPAFAELPLGAALASLSQLESEVRTTELNTLQHLSKKVGATTLRRHLAAFSTAASSTVAPGSIYQAELFLGSVLDLRFTPAQMRCNGRPVPVDSNHVGQVRFMAPRRLGPAVWTGTIRFKANGRDTTFQVRVPYRVVRR
ncbi:hypothetical protein [Hymenobacter properus]|uniref:Gliding motility-associated protein GldM first immunoglobulin-like domain-containing protein n=1 Tax=Hymenobacter properus TaxID=2791026 RepID=A0A931FJP5_9BACT|nr:hypothetical protein [Hymenobacter properus]MBF9140221.1 hypothetical protein [Hymenobacter properus]MBR7719028.1 hypothetical protein [Microvirga sp. SRT04]